MKSFDGKDVKMEFDNLSEQFSSEIFRRDGKILDFRIDRVVLPNGDKTEREYVKHKGAVAVLPLDNDGNVLLVKQYRYAVGRVTLEIPAGKLDFANEDRLSAAKRELREETGFTAEKLVPIGQYLGSPAINSEIIWLYFAENLCEGSQELDEDEFLNVVKLPLKTLVSMVMKGEIQDGKTAYAALWADKFLTSGDNNLQG